MICDSVSHVQPDCDLFWRHYGLRNQLERAAISVSNNIAEGFERGGNNELLAFLYISRGSVGEVRSMLRVLDSWKVFVNHKNQISGLTARCETIARQKLYGWIEQVKRSDFRGQRHLNVVTKPKASRSALDQQEKFGPMLRVLYSWKVFANHKNQIAALTACCESISKQLYGWIFFFFFFFFFFF